MSRTYRRQDVKNYTAPSYISYWSNGTKEDLEALEKRWIARFYGDTGWEHFVWSPPHGYRNHVNRKRRRHDKREIYKALRYDKEPLCSNWNCKDAESWGYW